MDLLPSEEQDEIVATVRDQLARDFALTDLAASDGATQVVDDVLWGRCAELGWFGLGLAEQHGGVGYTLVEDALLFFELGAHCTPGPFLATVLGARVAAAAGDGELTSAIVAGDHRVALAEPGPGQEHGGDAIEVGAAVRGRFRVTDGSGASLLLALHGDAAALVEASAAAIRTEPSLDPLVPLGTVDLDTPSLCHVADPEVALTATVLVASELAGIAYATAGQSTAYAKDREQFGRPVGSFQAVKHRCADMAVRADAALNQCRLAALAVAGEHDDATFQAEAARVVATDAAIANAEVNVQNHGGIGFTWEHPAHRYVTRARVRSQVAGTRFSHLASLLEAPAPV